MVSLAERALEGELGAGIMESVRGYGGRCATRHDADVGGWSDIIHSPRV